MIENEKELGKKALEILAKIGRGLRDIAIIIVVMGIMTIVASYYNR